MDERQQRVVPEGQEPSEALDPGRVISIVQMEPERRSSRSTTDVVIHLAEASEELELADRSRIDPNTGERIAHPSLHGLRLPLPTAAEQDAPIGDGRLREYLRLVEGP